MAGFLPSRCRMALKEWAVTQRALDQGEQVLLLRKGGIHEEGKDFRVVHPEFLIYPTYEHQREDLLKARSREDLRALLENSRNHEEITFTHWARVEEVMEIRDPATVEALSPFYIWTTSYAETRLHWKPRSPLLVLIVRVYHLQTPQTVPHLPAYTGCKSWVTLDQEVNLDALKPVLSDQDFQAKAGFIRRAVGSMPR